MSGASDGSWRLLADVGGTNVRFGACRAPEAGRPCEIAHVEVWPASGFRTFEDALSAYSAKLDDRVRFSSAAIAAAGPVTAGGIALTNSDWVITIAGVRRVLGDAVSVRLLNDLEAVACALPYLAEGAVEWWDGVHPPEPAVGRRLAINVGTGFGSAAIIAADGNWVCAPAESGHMRLGAGDAAEFELLTVHLSPGATVEDVLSGDGVQRLGRALAAGAQSNAALGVQDGYVFDFGASDPGAVTTGHVFGDILARVAGDLVLASAAWDGVYLTGSVALAFAGSANRDRFRRAFSGTSKLRERLARTPIGLIREPVPAFTGLAHGPVPVRG